jgi:hypothetical protein
MPVAETKTIASNWRTTAPSLKVSVQGKRVLSVITPGLNTYQCAVGVNGEGVTVNVIGDSINTSVSAGANGLS